MVLWFCFVFRCIHILLKSACWVITSVSLSSHLSVHVYQLSSLWMNFSDIWHWKLFLKTAEKIQICLKSVKKLGTLHDELSMFYCCWWYEVPIKSLFQWNDVRLLGYSRRDEHYKTFIFVIVLRRNNCCIAVEMHVVFMLFTATCASLQYKETYCWVSMTTMFSSTTILRTHWCQKRKFEWEYIWLLGYVRRYKSCGSVIILHCIYIACLVNFCI
jgi:hypothetical protein